MKEQIKQEQHKKQKGLCALTGVPLPKETKLFDTHRKIPRIEGGEYKDDNYIVLTPEAHMAEHNNLRERPADLDYLKQSMDQRIQLMRLRIKINNQLLAHERRTDHLDTETHEWIKEQMIIVGKKEKEQEKVVVGIINELAKTNALIKAALGVKGIGPTTIAFCLTYIDIEKADHASSLWSYVGIDKSKKERYTKGVAGGGNKTLRTALYTMADSQMKTRGAYRCIYDNVKTRLENSEKEVQTCCVGGAWELKKWKDVKPSHRHGAALRAVMKHFLADYWYVARTVAGLPVSALYPEAILGGTHRTIMPEERGWVYKKNTQ